MSNLYKNPLTPEQLNGAQSVSRTETFGTNFSVLGIGGFMEVYNISDLDFTIPPATTGPIELSGNTIPISFLKGTGAPFSYDVLTLGSDNISSGRRRLGMLVYVYETNQVYQHTINNYESLWTAATAATSTVVISDFGTTINNSTLEGQSFIDAWTASTVEGVSGVTRPTATWKKYYGNDISITGGTYNAFTSTLTLVNITGGTVPITGIGGGGGGGTTITGGTFSSNTGTLSLNSSAGTITVTGFTDYYVTGGTYTSGTLTLRNNSGGTFNVTGFYTGATDVYVTGGTFNGSQILFTNNTGGTFTVTGFTSGSSTLQYFISASTPTGIINIGDRWFDTNTGVEVVYINDGNSNQWVQPNAGGSFIGDYLPLSGGTVIGEVIFQSGITANTISATTYQNLPGGSSSNCVTTFYATNISGCSPVNMLTEVNMLSGLTVTGNGHFTGVITATTISATTYQNYPTNFTSGLTATTISATTYQNLPTDIRTTGGTYSNNTFTFTNNTGGTYSVLFNTVTGLTVNGNLTVTGTTSSPTFTGNSITLSNSASTISLNNTTQQQIRFFSGGTGAPTYNTYSAGAKIILSDNIDSISSGYAIGVDAGSLWYGADLAGNGHDWYAGTRKLMSLASSSGLELVGLGGPTTTTMTISGTSVLGSKGGVGYIDFLKVVNNFSGATNPNKWFRVNSTGGLEILNSVYTAPTLIISDDGIVTITSPASVTSNSATNNALNVGTKGQLFDDGNFHIHSSSGAVWINSLDGSAIRLGTQTNSGNSAVIVDTTTVGHSFFTKVQSGFNVAFGTEITMDNLKVRINGTGGSGGLVQGGAVSGSFAAYTTLVGNVAGSALQGDTNSGGITFTTTYQNISSGQKTLSSGGDTTTLHLIDTTNSRIYRITAIHCQGTTGGYTSIERMA